MKTDRLGRGVGGGGACSPQRLGGGVRWGSAVEGAGRDDVGVINRGVVWLRT